ncbi:MAG: NAD(P)-binding domain-containing protein [Opitutales bacterium]
MVSLIHRYTNWLHTQWPAGTVEKLPAVGPDGASNIKGVRIVGDLSGIPLLKFSADTGARAVQAFMAEPDFGPQNRGKDGVLDLAIIGAGVSGISAALEAKKAGLNFKIFEAVEPFSTIVNFPKAKPIYTYPTDMVPAGDMRFKADVKEDLLEELQAQRDQAGIETTNARITKVEKKGDHFELQQGKGDPIKAQKVVVAIGRSGNYRKLGIPGEEKDKCSNRLYDPKEFAGQKVMVVGGGDSALETAIALTVCGAHVTLSYRKPEFARPKPDNIEQIDRLTKDSACEASVANPSSDRVNTAASSRMRDKDAAPGSLCLMMASKPKEIRDDAVVIEDSEGKVHEVENDQVFIMIGREPPLDFFRRSGLNLANDRNTKFWGTLAAFFLGFTIFYHWAKGYIMSESANPGWLAWAVSSLGGLFQGAVDSPASPLYHLRKGMEDPGFYYSFAYCACVVIFGIRRIKRRRTPYVKLQTYTLMAVQCIPLFLLPYIVLPWLGALGVWDSGLGKWIGDALWPDGSYWRAFGLILAWPLFIYNWFTAEPIWGWLVLGFLQTFVLIPLIIRYWGKGAYCGWICSCGALAETLGDAHRHKMPHGPFWNKLNMTGQVILWVALLMMVIRIVGWVFPGEYATNEQGAFVNAEGSVVASADQAAWEDSWAAGLFNQMLYNFPLSDSKHPGINYKYIVDIWLAGVIGVGFYFHFSGRVWCRFACPLAALMHIYTRFTKFRIFTDKKKCISCNVCTSVCHQGIDIMNFANKGLPMEDPECVRCSACVQSCPTGVLRFGRYDKNGDIKYDGLEASPVLMKERRSDPKQVEAPVTGIAPAALESVDNFLKELKGLKKQSLN